MFTSFSITNIDITNVNEVFLNKDKHDNFYNILNDILKYAPENFYAIRELYKKLNENISLEDAHEIYKEHIKDDNYVLSSNDYEIIIGCILTNYSDPFIVSNKLLDVPAKHIIDYLVKNQTKNVFLSFIRTFLCSELLVESLFERHKEIKNKEDFAMFLGLLRISVDLEIKQMIDEMLLYSGDDFYKKVCYMENESTKYPSPTHFLAYEGEKDVNDCSYQIKIALLDNKL
ncbi:hypothetical protein EHP00_890 [Ecytonucleospora hepatopenaei]|uniref:Uncharacterized protein n=1 Tax=Ecytonucleospora hepatopenaei TaxID=646526 RepID=A0A1W0E3V8_9MICR|nr:hypothetical protein EHP00_890 [Ecytonucleospora hepatopenaei]